MGSGASPRTAQALVLTANPASGPVPLLVQFHLTRPNGTLPGLSWSFGDGEFLNGSAPTDFDPAHDYLRSGTFLCVVTIRWPTGSVNDSLPIEVAPLLTASFTVAPDSGAAPLTVWFNATVFGGTGTYLNYTWEFGDGDSGSGLSVRYTYATAGDYLARLLAVDSAGATANASEPVVVVAPAAARSSPSNSDPIVSVTVPLVAGILAGAGIASGVAYLSVRRFRGTDPARDRLPPTPADVPNSSPPPGSPPPAPPVPPTAEPSRPVADTTARPPGPSSDGPIGPSNAPEGTSTGSPNLATPSRITDALVRHLGGLPKLWPNDIPSKAWTQAGIAEAIGAGQSAVSRVLRRLVAAGIVTVETRHVGGSVRRLRIYRLTERGERLGRALREIRPPGPPSGGG